MSEQKRVRCLVFSRVVGYLQPTSQWNKGKQQEWVDRITYKVKGELDAKAVERVVSGL